MLKYITIPLIVWGNFFEANAATQRDKAAKQFEQRMNGLNIPNNDYSQYNDNQANFPNTDYTDYNSGNGQQFDSSNMVDNNNQSMNTYPDDGSSNFSEQVDYNTPPTQDDLTQKVKDLEDDMGDMMRRIGKLERELKKAIEKHEIGKKKNTNKTAKKAKKK